ncbi:MAG: hypothetical protein M3Y85_02610, partial [Bacteroidota bacterium]|nr:hypothetical protein [Bacteroidota bacterium]
LVPPSLKDIGLVSSIKELLENINCIGIIQCQFLCNSIDENSMDEGLKLTIYRIIQEQTTNILKYAGASSLTINLCRNEEELNLVIDDNGKGFDTSKHRKGVGITNIINRANIYRGTVTINSGCGTGCCLRVGFEMKDQIPAPKVKVA